jgi:hypothetical protein
MRVEAHGPPESLAVGLDKCLTNSQPPFRSRHPSDPADAIPTDQPRALRDRLGVTLIIVIVIVVRVLVRKVRIDGQDLDRVRRLQDGEDGRREQRPAVRK